MFPTLVTIVLNELETNLGKEFIVVRYADNFILLGKTKHCLLSSVRSKRQNCLSTLGVQLNESCYHRRMKFVIFESRSSKLYAVKVARTVLMGGKLLRAYLSNSMSILKNYNSVD
jgi:hypothetical protein